MRNNQNINKTIFTLTILFSMMLNAESVLTTASEGRKPTSKLTYRKSGVPVFEMNKKKGDEVGKVKEIPRLDIGEEKKVKASAAELKLPTEIKLNIIAIMPKQAIPLLVIPQVMLTKVTSAKPFTAESAFSKIPSIPSFSIVSEPQVETPEPVIKNMVEIKPDEYKMIQALILLEYQKKYDLAMSLFSELIETKQYHAEALYHYAESALGLELLSEFRQKMIQVMQESKDVYLKKLAVEMLTKNVSALSHSDIAIIDPLVESLEIDVTKNEKYLLKKAKYFSEKGDLGKLESALVFIPTSSLLYPEAALLKAVLNYRLGQVDTAIAELELAWPSMESNKKDTVRNLSALTLARLYFQKGDYKTAYKNFVQVDKSSSIWLQAMVEEAWTQILSGDYEGAAGNMFSLHTDFFRKAYAPDSYIVRTVGYLNLCQFGDGMSVLNDLKNRYSSVQTKMLNYQKRTKDPVSYYDVVITWLKNTKTEEVDGLPRSFIVELARHPHFMNLQKQINNFEDENGRFNKIAVDLIRKERETRMKMIQTKNEFAALKRESASASKIQRKAQEFLAATIEHSLFDSARESIKKSRLAAVARMDKDKEALRVQAGKGLQARYKNFISSLGNLVDQRDVLSYEIYSGAGEHIRYQMAGGEVKDRNPAALTPDEKQSYKWKFKGEVWEDELGHYRSSLKNVCPSDEIAQNQGSN